MDGMAGNIHSASLIREILESTRVDYGVGTRKDIICDV
jgi:hypothetical protein